jgi:tetratricopeptide (TPR) repeat protein/TolB-like protein
MSEQRAESGRVGRLLRELKRRRVFRVAIAYGAAAWVVIEVATTTFGPLGLSAGLETAVVTVALLGFPVAVALAWAFDITSRGLERTTAGDRPRPPILTRTTTHVLLASAALLGVAVLAAGAWWAIQRSRVDVDHELVAVLPFRVAGADPTLAFMREGLVDLLTVRLAGVQGTRSLDARTVLAGWRDAVRSESEDLPPAQAAAVGVALGAGRVLLGHVAGTPDAVVVGVRVVDAASGGAGEPVEVRGPVDSLPELVERLAVQVLALEAGEDEHRLRFLVGPSSDAVRAYLDGRQLARRGRYADAISRFREALTVDSTFALAASEMGRAESWIAGSSDAYERAWLARERLGPRDVALLEARLGPDYPARATGRQLITAAQRAVRLAPGSPDAWFQLGDWFFHLGRLTAAPRWEERADSAFDRAIALDPSFAAPLMHATELAAFRGDTARVRRLGEAFFAHNSIGEAADYMRWLVPASLGDEEALVRVYERLDSVENASMIRWMTAVTQAEQLRSQDFDVLLDALARGGFSDSRYAMMLNAGRPAEAAAVLDKLLPTLTQNGQRFYRVRMIESALYGGADTVRGAEAAAALATIVDGPPSESDRGRFLNDLWTVTEWRIWHGDTTGARRTLRLLRERDPSDSPNLVAASEFTALLLDAMLAVLQDRSDADQLLNDLESRFAEGLHANVAGREAVIILPRLLEMRGQPARALDLIRRRMVQGVVTWHLSTMKREEGRLAVLVGDTAGAIAAYSHYLAMRQNVEPEVQPEVDRVREELLRLTGESR